MTTTLRPQHSAQRNAVIDVVLKRTFASCCPAEPTCSSVVTTGVATRKLCGPRPRRSSTRRTAWTLRRRTGQTNRRIRSRNTARL